MSIDVPAPAAGTATTRRELFQVLAGLGVGSTVFQRALAADMEKSKEITAEMIQQAEWISGIKLSDNDRKALVGKVNSSQRDFEELRAVKLGNHVPPALSFQPAPWLSPADGMPRGTVEPTVRVAPKKPDSNEDLAFMPLTALAALIRTRQLSSVELTRLYLERLRRYDPALHCVVTFTEDLALKQAEKADREIAAGRYRGPLHGIPWGAKDLIAYPGYKTTWGAAPFKGQVFDTRATVARKLDAAGAVLVAKLTLGRWPWGIAGSAA